MKEKLLKIREALEINTRKTAFIVRDYPDDKEAKKGVALGKESLPLIDNILSMLDSPELRKEVIREFRFEQFPDETFSNEEEVAEAIIEVFKNI